MMRRGLFRRKKSVEGQEASSQGDGINASMASRLLELCGADTELYQSLARILIIDPKRITVPLDSFIAEAQDYEAKGDRLRAELAYRIAGSIALYKGDPDGVRTNFAKALSLAARNRPEYRTVTEHSADAVAVARRFYETEQVP